MPPTLLVRREDTYSAQWALDSAVWLRSDALTTIEVLLEEHIATYLILLVLVSVLALCDQMFVERGNLDDLLTLPACGEHGTLFPVMDVNRLFIKVLVVCAAKIADFLIYFLPIAV